MFETLLPVIGTIHTLCVGIARSERTHRMVGNKGPKTPFLCLIHHRPVFSALPQCDAVVMCSAASTIVVRCRLKIANAKTKLSSPSFEQSTL